MSVEMASLAALDEATFDAFLHSIHGTVILPESDGYDEARAVQNGLIDKRPAVTVQSRGVADVINTVNFARDNNLLLAVRGGGHNVAGSAVCDDGVVLDLSMMRGVHVDPVARTAHVQGGAIRGDVDRETQVFGLATPGGMVSTTGVAGLTLHDGMGHLRRKHGLTIDNLKSVDVVTADGSLQRASATENPDLFWAIRGGGGNFGVVTSFEFHLHSLGPDVMLSAVAYSPEDAPLVLRKWRAFMETAPEEITSLALFWSIPADPPAFPEELRNMPVLLKRDLFRARRQSGYRPLLPGTALIFGR